SLGHGVSLSSRGSGRLVTRLDTPPSSHRHHPDSAIAPSISATPEWEMDVIRAPSDCKPSLRPERNAARPKVLAMLDHLTFSQAGRLWFRFHEKSERHDKAVRRVQNA
ncbi:hypothetical protein, partial [Bradyrhizobium liaoningense]|uniref:hypothetical protein n=1 Tax=Bradyrhizobium liaoningense TaxID=43992 RepID=UPI0024E045CE